MPVNRNALIRYKTIDQCLRNRFRKWTLEDLIDACSDALYEYEGIDKGVSKRSVQSDIQMMRSDKLGYNAPIIVVDRKYYTYEDPTYSITNMPITDQDLMQLSETVEILKQFGEFRHFREFGGMVKKLEDHVNSKRKNTRAVIDFEKNELLKGLEYLDPLYEAITNKSVLKMTYRSFRAKQSNAFSFHPYLLKEYNNRWFVLGQKELFPQVNMLALDRIQSLEVITDELYIENEELEAKTFFKDVIGVTVNRDKAPIDIELFIHKSNAPYVLTKPMHSSQELLETVEHGIIIRICVQHNYELERELLGFGEALRVLKPEGLRERIIKRIEYSTIGYNMDIGSND